MTVLMRMIMACLLCAALNLNCFGQPAIITTDADSGLPGDGALAITKFINFPISVAPDGIGGFYLSTENRIYYAAADGRLRLVAGNGARGFSGDRGPAMSAQLAEPRGVAVDSLGNLYIADTGNHRIRKVAQSGVITTIAGNGIGGYGGDNRSAISAQLKRPSAIAVDNVGNLFIADTGNYCIRKITPGGMIATVVGNGISGYSGDGGLATSAQLGVSFSIAMDPEGNLYIADFGNPRIRKVSPNGVIATVAGNGANGYSGDGGPATSARLAEPRGIAADSAGNLYIADTKNHLIRKVTPDGMIKTIAGNGTPGFSGDGGSAISARLNYPIALAVDSKGILYIADNSNRRIRKITPDGVITTAAGNGTNGPIGDNGPAISAHLWQPEGVAVDSKGNLYIADSRNYRIRKITPDGVIVTIAGNGTRGYNGDGGPAISAQLSYMRDLAVDYAGNLYIADTGNHRIRKVTSAGMITTIAGNEIKGRCSDSESDASVRLNIPTGVAVDSMGDLYVADTNHCRIHKFTPDMSATIITDSEARGYCDEEDFDDFAIPIATPGRLAVDATGNLYIADNHKNRIRKVTPDGVIITLAGKMKENYSGDSINPAVGGLAVDAAGNFYIADNANSRIRKVTPAGVITIFAGNGKEGYSGDGGPATSASLYTPRGVAVDSAGNLYIADTGNNRIRKVTPEGVIMTVAGNGD
jgi:sugar lactone lactonase YvrE